MRLDVRGIGMGLGKTSRAPRSGGTNVAIAATALAMPLLVAAGFLSGRAPSPVGPGPWPELRGTFEGGADTAAAARTRPGR